MSKSFLYTSISLIGFLGCSLPTITTASQSDSEMQRDLGTSSSSSGIIVSPALKPASREELKTFFMEHRALPFSQGNRIQEQVFDELIKLSEYLKGKCQIKKTKEQEECFKQFHQLACAWDQAIFIPALRKLVSGQGSLVDRSLLISLYPQLEPYYLAYQQLTTPIIKKLAEWKLFDLSQSFGVIKGFDGDSYMGFQKEEESSYNLFFGQASNGLEHHYMNFGRSNLIQQGSFLVDKGILKAEGGLILRPRDKNGEIFLGGKLQVSQHSNPSSSYRIDRVSSNLPLTHPWVRHLYEEVYVNAPKTTKTEHGQVFVAFPQTQADQDMVALLLLEEVQKEESFYGRVLQSDKEFADLLGTKDPAQTFNGALEVPNQEALAQELSVGSTLLMSQPSQNPIVQTSVSQAQILMEKVKAEAERSLQAKLNYETQIQLEQEARKKLTLSMYAEQPQLKKKKSKKGPSSASLVSSPASPGIAAAASASSSSSSIDNPLTEKIFKRFKIESAIKYRNFIQLMKAAWKSTGVKDDPSSVPFSSTQSGSHVTLHDDLGALTWVVPHAGSDDKVHKTVANNILKRFISGLLTKLNPSE